MRGLGVLAVLAGCGRLGFGTGELADGGATGETAQPDGASSGGTGSDASGSDGATVAPCSPDYIICDHFEGASIDSATWTAGSMVSLDATRAHSGEGSVHIHTPAFNAGGTSYKFLSETKTVAIASTFWVRGWFYLSALPASTNALEMITAEIPGSSGDYVFVRSNLTSVYSQFQDNSTSTTSTVPSGSWFCLVWKVVRSTTTTGSLEISGAVPTTALTNARTDGAPAITTVNLGMGFSGSNVVAAQPAIDLWIDDVIIDDAVLTCAD